MSFRASEWDFICTKCNKQGTYDLIVYNPLTKELFEERVDAELIHGLDSYGNPYSAAEIGRKTFDIIAKKLARDGGACSGFFDGDCYAAETSKKAETSKIPKETVLKGIKGELSEEELDSIVQVELEWANYYDFDAFLSVIHRFLRGEISKEYYRNWLILVCRALSNNKFKENSKKDLLYEDISDCFDGHAFDELDEEKELQCNEMIAYLKYYNHRLDNIGKAEMPPFYNEGRVAVYVHFDFCNHHNVHYKLCVADGERKIFRTTVIANPAFLEAVNYTFVDDDEFDDLRSVYYEFYHDKTMDIHKYIAELPYLDVNGNECD